MIDTEQQEVEISNAKARELLLTAPEICVWMTIYGGLRTLAEVHAEYKQQKITEKQYFKRTNLWLTELAETADATHRFEVLLPATAEPHYRHQAKSLEDSFVRVRFYPSFWRWFNWWSDYIETLSATEKKHIYHLAMERMPEVEKYRPEGSWLNYRSDPSLVISQQV